MGAGGRSQSSTFNVGVQPPDYKRPLIPILVLQANASLHVSLSLQVFHLGQCVLNLGRHFLEEGERIVGDMRSLI